MLDRVSPVQVVTVRLRVLNYDQVAVFDCLLDLSIALALAQLRVATFEDDHEVFHDDSIIVADDAELVLLVDAVENFGVLTDHLRVKRSFQRVKSVVRSLMPFGFTVVICYKLEVA